MEEGEGNPPSREGSINEDADHLAQTYEHDDLVTAEPTIFEFAQQYLTLPVDPDEMQEYPDWDVEYADLENVEFANQVQNVNAPVLTSGSESGHQVSNISGYEGNTLDTSIPVVQPAFHLTGREDQNVEMPSAVESPLQYIDFPEKQLPYAFQDLLVLDQSTLNVLKNSESSQESHSNEPIPSTSKQARLMQEKRVPFSSSSETRTHSREKRYLCEECGKRFYHRSHLTEHTRTHTGEKPYVCEICGRRFTHSSTLTIHTRTHTGARPFVCKTCGQRFTQRSHLTDHTRTHTREKPYLCEDCGQQFSQSSNLTRHRRTHTGAKPFVCNTCCKRFSQGSALTEHTRTHTRAKPQICKTCGKRFTQRSHLIDHTRTHTGAKPYVCEICGRRFSQSSNLTKHRRTHIGDEIDERGAVNESRDTGNIQVATSSGDLVNTPEANTTAVVDQISTNSDTLVHGVQSSETGASSGQSNDAQDVNNSEEQRNFDLEEDPTDFETDGNFKQDD